MVLEQNSVPETKVGLRGGSSTANHIPTDHHNHNGTQTQENLQERDDEIILTSHDQRGVDRISLAVDSMSRCLDEISST